MIMLYYENADLKKESKSHKAINFIISDLKNNRPVKAIFKSPPDGIEVSWISNYSTIQGVGTEIHWNSKRAGKIYKIIKIK